MPANQTKITIYNPKVEPDPRDLVASSRREFRDEEEATELAMRVALEDPSEVDHLAKTTARARARLKAAATELLRSLIALLFAWLARVFLNQARKKVTEQRGVIGRAESSVLALQRLLSRFWVRWLLGRRNLLRMLGATVREDDEGNPVCSLKLAERRYRANEGLCGQGYASAADSPTTRVVIGVRSAAGEVSQTTWCLKRFVSTGTGGWRPVNASYEADAKSLVLAFYSEPAVRGQLASAGEPSEEAAEEAPRHQSPEQAGAEPGLCEAA
ncbi:hypothetical protein [Rubrobacter aplysinae]|uniref:hypothetical protein n=1 Tax=Rubrobacter aplysinae TaxID=909625 RepID=UPI00064BF6B1|nr:hypothetical protein [Rubrobacter aplysinae]